MSLFHLHRIIIRLHALLTGSESSCIEYNGVLPRGENEP